ncbi:MAG: hypothetical protein FJ033_14845 [Chloroflexi bacterium]|nr:hypothetical protein [Chloroflexota bacterium]
MPRRSTRATGRRHSRGAAPSPRRGAPTRPWWRTALARDPRNFTVRKQIWRAAHPEWFYPTIDLDWQREQLDREGWKSG